MVTATDLSTNSAENAGSRFLIITKQKQDITNLLLQYKLSVKYLREK